MPLEVLLISKLYPLHQGNHKQGEGSDSLKTAGPYKRAYMCVEARALRQLTFKFVAAAMHELRLPQLAGVGRI